MRLPPTFSVLLLLALGLAGLGWGWGWSERRSLRDAEFTGRRLTLIESENRRLHDVLDAKEQADEDAVALQQRLGIEHQVEELRSLRFLRPVTFREIPRSDLPGVLRQKLAQQVPDQELGNTEIGLSTLGLLPRGLDLKKTYLALLGEQVGAFYDQHSKELFTFRGQSLRTVQNRVILAHELTHALEDQHFDLMRLPLEAKGNDDRAMAASALVEGDATLVMNRYMADGMSASVLRDSLASAFSTDVRQLAAAPRFLRESLLFPYLRGLEFCQALYDQGGWEALKEAFAHPPASTAEILHPARYASSRPQEPVTIALSPSAVMGHRPVDDNVLGEFGIRQLLIAWLKDDQFASGVAEHWRGDRFLVYGDAAASSCVWETCWEDQSSADRFADALDRCLHVRYKEPRPTAGHVPDGPVHLQAVSFGVERRAVLIARLDSNEIVLIDAQDEPWLEALKTSYPGLGESK